MRGKRASERERRTWGWAGEACAGGWALMSPMGLCFPPPPLQAWPGRAGVFGRQVGHPPVAGPQQQPAPRYLCTCAQKWSHCDGRKGGLSRTGVRLGKYCPSTCPVPHLLLNACHAPKSLASSTVKQDDATSTMELHDVSRYPSTSQLTSAPSPATPLGTLVRLSSVDSALWRIHALTHLIVSLQPPRLAI